MSPRQLMLMRVGLHSLASLIFIVSSAFSAGEVARPLETVVSGDYVDLPLADVVADLRQKSQSQILVEPGIARKKVTFKVTEVPLSDALEVLATLNKVEFQIVSDVAVLRAASSAVHHPGCTPFHCWCGGNRDYRLRSLKASEVVTVFRAMGLGRGPLLTAEDGYVVANPAENVLSAAGPDEVFHSVEKLLAEWDRPGVKFPFGTALPRTNQAGDRFLLIHLTDYRWTKTTGTPSGETLISFRPSRAGAAELRDRVELALRSCCVADGGGLGIWVATHDSERLHRAYLDGSRDADWPEVARLRRGTPKGHWTKTHNLLISALRVWDGAFVEDEDWPSSIEVIDCKKGGKR